MIDYDIPGSVTVYHRCPDFAAGSVFLGPRRLWWYARSGPGTWHVWLPGVHEPEHSFLVERIRADARLDLNAGQAARAAQDARAEAPDL